MNLRQFGNAFKQAVATKLANNELSLARARKIYPRNLSDRKEHGTDMILQNLGNNYDYPNIHNDPGGSVIIDSYWAVFQGMFDIRDDDNQILSNGGNPFNTNLRGGEAGSVQLPNDIDITINHGSATDRIDLTGGVAEDWQDNNHARIGYLLGLLYARGYEHYDIFLGADNNLFTYQQDGSMTAGGYAGLLTFDKNADWIDNFDRVNEHASEPEEFFLAGYDLIVPNLSPVGFGGGLNERDISIMKKWLTCQAELGIRPPERLTPKQCQELHRLGYQPEDLANGQVVGGTAGHVNVFDWVNGRWVEDFASIEKVHKLGDWFRAVDPDVNEPTRVGNYVRTKLADTSGFGFGFGGLSGDRKIMSDWLTRQREVGIEVTNRLTGPQVQELHKLGWDPTDLKNDDWGDWRTFDPLTGTDLVGIDNILVVGKVAKFRAAFDTAEPTGGEVVGLIVRTKLRNIPFDYVTIDSWLNVIYQQGVGPNNLTPAHIQRLHQQGWEATDIITMAGDYGRRDFTVINPATGEQVNPGGFTNVDNLGLKWELWPTAMSGPAAGFRNQALDPTNPRDRSIMESWFKLTKMGGGKIANNQLTAANARALWDNNWESSDIKTSRDGSEWAVWNPVTNDWVEGFAAIVALGDKKVLENTAKTNFRANFRTAAALAVNKKAQNELATDNDDSNYVIDQYMSDKNISPEDAVTAYNNGWIYGLEICFNDDKTQLGVTPNGGKNWYQRDWSTETRDNYLQNILTNDFARQQMSAYQVDETGNCWNPSLSEGEKNSIRKARNEEMLKNSQKGIRFARFRTAVRAAATGQAATDLGHSGLFTPFNSDFIIDQFNKDGITPSEVVAAYNRGWIYGLEIRIDGGRKQYRFAEGGWQNLDWTKNDRNVPFNALSPKLRQAKTKALQADTDGNRWNPPLDKREIEELLAATDITELSNLANKIPAQRKFIADFRHTLMLDVPLRVATETDILIYFNLETNLTGGQAALFYNGDPQVLGSELSKGADENKILFNGQMFDLTALDVVNQLRTAKQTKITADKVAAAAARLATFQTTAETVIKNSQKATQPEITDAELNQHLKDKVKVFTDTVTTWQDYLKAAASEVEVNSRQAKIITAITKLRKVKKKNPPFDAVTARAAAIATVKNYWKTKSNDQSETGTINGKKLVEVLGADWENELADKNSQAAIDSKQKELTAKIDAEKAKESKPKKLTGQQIKQAIQSVLGNAIIEPKSEVIRSWQTYDNPNSELKTMAEIQTFLAENIKGQVADFAKFIAELPDITKPIGATNEEKVNNFLANNKSEIVIKAIFQHELKNESFRAEVETEMENEKDNEEPLDAEIYPKENGKYSQAAMVRYLYEKKTGQSHLFSTQEQEEWERSNTPPIRPSHWDKYKYWYAAGSVVVLVIVLVVIFWEKLVGSAAKEQ